MTHTSPPLCPVPHTISHTLNPVYPVVVVVSLYKKWRNVGVDSQSEPLQEARIHSFVTIEIHTELNLWLFLFCQNVSLVG